MVCPNTTSSWVLRHTGTPTGVLWLVWSKPDQWRIGIDNVRNYSAISEVECCRGLVSHHRKHRTLYNTTQYLSLLAMPGPLRNSFMKNWWAVEVRTLSLILSKDIGDIDSCHLRPFQCKHCHHAVHTHSPTYALFLQLLCRRCDGGRLYVVPHPPCARSQW